LKPCNPARKNAQTLEPLCVPQLFFSALLNRNINPDSDQPRRPSGIIHKSSTPHEHPARLLRAMRISKLRLEKSLVLLAAAENLPHCVAIVAVNQFKECLGPGAGLGRKAKDLPSSADQTSRSSCRSFVQVPTIVASGASRSRSSLSKYPLRLCERVMSRLATRRVRFKRVDTGFMPSVSRAA
jgi:hypothetical protein